MVLVNQEIPDSLQKDISEPKLTNQLLDLNQTSMDLYAKSSKSVTRMPSRDQLACTVSGTQQIAVVSAWEHKSMRINQEFPEGGYLPSQFSPVDLFSDAFRDAKVHIVALQPGDCMYIPSHWWYQTLSAPD